MKDKIKTLSEKRIKIHNFPKRESYNYSEPDVKEFIKELKKLLVNGNYYGNRSFTHLFKEIDNLTGDLEEEK